MLRVDTGWETAVKRGYNGIPVTRSGFCLTSAPSAPLRVLAALCARLARSTPSLRTYSRHPQLGVPSVVTKFGEGGGACDSPPKNHPNQGSYNCELLIFLNFDAQCYLNEITMGPRKHPYNLISRLLRF